MPRISADIVAIDAHVHLSDARALAARPQRAEQMAKYFKRGGRSCPWRRWPSSIDSAT